MFRILFATAVPFMSDTNREISDFLKKVYNNIIRTVLKVESDWKVPDSVSLICIRTVLTVESELESG